MNALDVVLFPMACTLGAAAVLAVLGVLLRDREPRP